MIDAKRAVQVAKQYATDMLAKVNSNLEEIERESYKDRDVWSITLSYPRDPNTAGVVWVAVDPQQYKRFLIDVETGELVAMKLREPAFR